MIQSKVFLGMFSAIALTLLTLPSTSWAGWENLDEQQLREVISDKTWIGKKFKIFWSADGRRKVVADDLELLEDWTITEDEEAGTMVCAGAGTEMGERCSVIQKKKKKYRGIRIRPNGGKKTKFKVKDGIPAF
ncbi:MAG: hypothetical protein AAF402_09370 [Pseudomonadota bacterium]